MTWAVGGTYRYVADLGATGLTVTWTSGRINGSSAGANPAVTDLLDGSYEFSWVIATAGPHSWRGTASNGAVVTVNFVAVTAAQADPTAAVGLTAERVAKLDHLDAAVSTRAAGSAWTAARARRLDLIITGRITVRQPIAADGTIELVAGNAYLDANGRAIDVVSDGWPDLADAESITFGLYVLGNETPVWEKALALVDPDDPESLDQTLRLELAASDTAGLDPSASYHYRIDAVLANGAPVRLARDSVAVKR